MPGGGKAGRLHACRRVCLLPAMLPSLTPVLPEEKKSMLSNI